MTAERPETETRHDLKVWPEFFDALIDGRKTFEARRNDRNFQAGDVLLLREWEPAQGRYTGRSMERRISYVLRGDAHLCFGIGPEHVVLALAPEPAERPETGLVASPEALLRHKLQVAERHVEGLWNALSVGDRLRLTIAGLNLDPIIGPLREAAQALASRAAAPPALHAAASKGQKCSDCTIDQEPCPTCYAAWWKGRHPNVEFQPAPPQERPTPAAPTEKSGEDPACTSCDDTGIRSFNGAYCHCSRGAALAKDEGATPAAEGQEPVVEITYELGNKFWHTNCPKNSFHSGIMRAVAYEPDRSLIECMHCGQRGYYPVGGVGRVCSALVQPAAKGQE